MPENKPVIRFKGFEEDWEQRKLIEVARYRNGKAHEQNIEENGKYIVVNSKFVSTNGRVRKHSNTIIEPLKKNELAFVLSDVPNGKAIARTFLVDKEHIYSLNQRIAGITPHKDTDSYFLNVLMNRNPYFLKFDNGVGQTNLTKTDVENFAEKYPSYKEQKKIGTFFKQLDDTITLHQRKLDLLKQMKKGFLQRIFPKNDEKVPTLRFSDFTGEWEQHKLGEIAPLRGGFAFKSNNFKSEGVPIVRISNILSSGKVGNEFVYYDNQEKDENYLLPDEAAVLAMSGATTGKVSILDNPYNHKYYQNQRVGYFIPTKNIDYKFISTIVRSKLFLDQLNSVLVAGAQPNISSKDIGGFEFLVPKNIEEQQNIGILFKQLDSLITLHQEKLDKLVTLKKSYLQKMFI